MQDIAKGVKPSQIERASPGHLNSLDGLRGLAALIVMLGHSAYVYFDCANPQGLVLTLVNVIRRAGHPTVILFFALSGFVLYFAFFKRPDTPYRAYLIRRLFRIYPALLVSLLIALGLNLAQSPTALPGLGLWTHLNWVIPTDPMTFARNALMLGISGQDIALDPVTWSLVIELRFSVIFVLLALLCRRSPWALLVVSLVSHLAGRMLIHRLGLHQPYLTGGGSVLGAAAITAFYLPAFGFGIVAGEALLKRRTPLKMPGWSQIVLAAGLFVAGKLINDDFAWCVVAAGLVAIMCQPGPMATVLALPPCKFLGDISYSLYLVHFPILMAIVYGLSPKIGLVPAIVLAPVVSTLVATAMHRYVELPGIRLGKRAAAAIT
jgi:peptidoglycan/LPS O-acetylase OafA/YrhL